MFKKRSNFDGLCALQSQSFIDTRGDSMKKILFISMYSAFAIILSASLSSAMAANGEDDAVRSFAQKTQPIPTKIIPINNNGKVYWDVSHVANGVALRNKASGWIQLRGVPTGASVVQAFLYWNFSDKTSVGIAEASVLLDGNKFIGKKVTDNIDPCWGLGGNHTYMTDVTTAIPTNNPNEDFRVMSLDHSSTTGHSPWSPPSSTTVNLNGASLIILYKDKNTSGKHVQIYDQLSGTGFSSTLNVNLTDVSHPFVNGDGLFTMIGADGQRTSYTNSASNETTTFNGLQIAGPPIAASDWDGSAGWPLPQLWDVHTHQVKLSSSGTQSVQYVANGDCLVPVAFVLEGLPH